MINDGTSATALACCAAAGRDTETFVGARPPALATRGAPDEAAIAAFC